MSEWQLIETAPKDGTMVLLWWPFWRKDRAVVGKFGFEGIRQWFASEALEGDGDPPTHWMPLPDPPAVRCLSPSHVGMEADCDKRG